MISAGGGESDVQQGQMSPTPWLAGMPYLRQRADLTATGDTPDARTRAARFSQLLHDFALDWRQLCALHGSSGQAHAEFLRLAQAVHEAAVPLAKGLAMRGNSVGALLVLEQRVLQHVVDPGTIR